MPEPGVSNLALPVTDLILNESSRSIRSEIGENGFRPILVRHLSLCPFDQYI
jgi:hypothetical protein